MYKPDESMSKREITGRKFLEALCKLYNLPVDMVEDITLFSPYNDVVKLHVVIRADRKLLSIAEWVEKASE